MNYSTMCPNMPPNNNAKIGILVLVTVYMITRKRR